MPNFWNPAQHEAMNQDNRQMLAAGVDLPTILEDIKRDINESNIGAAATAAEIDALCQNAPLAQDLSTTSGLVFGISGGRLFNGNSIVEVAATTKTLTNNTTNYIELLSNGSIVAGTSGFNAARMPLWQVTTSGGQITGVVNKRPVLSFIFPEFINATVAHTHLKRKLIQVSLGTISSTATARVVMPDMLGTIKTQRLYVTTTVAVDDSDYWTFSAVNKESSGTGTTPLLYVGDDNTTKTAGEGLTANVGRVLQNHGTAANLEIDGPHVLEYTFTKTGSAPNLVNAILAVEVEYHD